ncbi:MAG: hypothetical protein ABSF90_31730, partial [Syntrophobacteraceae bacterium]
ECASALKTEEKEENARLIFDRQAGRLSHRRFWQTFSPAVILARSPYAKYLDGEVKNAIESSHNRIGEFFVET